HGAFDNAVGGEITPGDEAAMSGLVAGDEIGGGSVVEFVRAFRLEPGEGGGELGLAGEIAGGVGIAVAEKNPAGGGVGREEVLAGPEVLGQGGGHDEAIGGEPAGGFQQVGPTDVAGTVVVPGVG